MTAESNRKALSSGDSSKPRVRTATSSQLDRTSDSRQRIAAACALSRTVLRRENGVEDDGEQEGDSH
jgi:hypothetical protein